MSDCERWVRETLPLEASVATQAVREARRRASELRLDESSYATRLSTDRAEVERLLRLVVPPETWLFRHGACFELVREWLLAHPGQRVRMLSLGCARGAEPFSLAATAASVGRTAIDTEIIGVDWCEDNLREAADGACSPLAQRGALPEWAGAFFAPDARGWLRLADEPCAMLRWRHADMLRDELPATAEIVLCRNVAIYLDDTARRKLARRLRSITDPGGLLAVGHADPTSLWEEAFEPAAPTASFTHRVRTGEPRRDTPAMAPSRAPAPGRSPEPVIAPQAVHPPPRVPEPAATIEAARELADEGRLDESAAMLERLLGLESLHAGGWSLLGAVRLAQRRPHEAEDCFRKVVYLQPNHALSLLQLSALAESRGDHASADRLRLRAARAATGSIE